MIRTEEQHLAHYGILRRSGRYPWGSGGTQSARNKSYLQTINDLKKKGMSDAEIARGFGITVNELRGARSIASAQQRQANILTAQRHKEKGWSNSEIGRRMGVNESTVRSWLAPGAKDKADAIQTTSNMLKDQLKTKKYIDVGVGVERHVGVTRTRLDNAIAALKEEGYVTHTIQVKQIGTGKYTKLKVLAPPKTPLSEVQKNRAEIKQITDYSETNGRSFFTPQPPISISSKRIRVNYKEDGGDKADGMIYVRPGKKDLSMGSSPYSQVRIMVDGTHYLKGMAAYKDDLPAGADLVFNTSKSNTGRKKDALKPISEDPDLPFGAVVRQLHGPDGKVTSAMNIVGIKEGFGEAGAWDKYKRNLPSQMLSKQSPDLAIQQLKVTHERRQREYDEINSLTHPLVRKDLLLKFADQTDSAAVHLRAAALPRQSTKVLLPLTTIKPTEIYSPGLRNGERVALIRFPHGGKFEIPELTVNNRNREGRKLFGTGSRSIDAAGVHHSVAQHLSGADFDGDFVLVIPNSRKTIDRGDPLADLTKFDPMSYRLDKNDPTPRIKPDRKQQEMGNISNLITDMTIHGASTDEIVRAVKHSMVVIDAENHELNWRQSEKDHGIAALKERYQGGSRAGAKTLISRAGSPIFLPQRQERPPRRGGPIDPVTGKKVFEPTGRMVPERKRITDPVTGEKVTIETGKMVPKKERHEKLAVVDDAFELVDAPGTRMEVIYATHSNQLKALANQARKEAVRTKASPSSPSAKKVYKHEVASLNAKLNVAEKNAPLERQAQLLANSQVSLRRQANPHMRKETVKKLEQQELSKMRARTGAKKDPIVITPKEWEAIQAGAISNSKLERILKHSDIDTVKRLAMPKHTPKLTTTKLRRAQQMEASGFTQQEIADALGVGLTTLKIGLNE